MELIYLGGSEPLSPTFLAKNMLRAAIFLPGTHAVVLGVQYHSRESTGLSPVDGAIRSGWAC